MRCWSYRRLVSSRHIASNLTRSESVIIFDEIQARGAADEDSCALTPHQPFTEGSVVP